MKAALDALSSICPQIRFRLTSRFNNLRTKIRQPLTLAPLDRHGDHNPIERPARLAEAFQVRVFGIPGLEFRVGAFGAWGLGYESLPLAEVWFLRFPSELTFTLDLAL